MRSATIHFRANTRPDRLSLRAALGVWAALAIAGWLVVAWFLNLIFGG